MQGIRFNRHGGWLENKMLIHLDDTETLQLMAKIRKVIDKYKIETKRLMHFNDPNDPMLYTDQILIYKNIIKDLEDILGE
jgi:regulator of sigma D